MGRFQPNPYQSQREEQTFKRLHQLVAKGYRVDFAEGCEQSIDLVPVTNAPRLSLWFDGTVYREDGNDFDHGNDIGLRVIHNSSDVDDKVFQRFLRTLQQPNLREKTAPFRYKHIWPWVSLGVFFAVMAFSFKAAEAVWRALFG